MRVGDSRRLAPYLLLGAVLCALMLAQTVNRQWSTDYWVHQATVETFRDHLTDPPNELTHSDDPSFSYTPYTFVLAGIARTTGLASVTVLQLAAVANLLLFLVTFTVFVTELTRRRLAAVFALLGTLLLWGITPWRWSGFLNLNSIGFGLPYPSMFATAVAFAVGWALLRYAATERLPWLLLFGGGSVVVALTHPFTSVWMTVMLLALMISGRMFRRELLLPLAGTALIAIGLIALWPYYSFFELLREGEEFAGLHDALYEGIPWRLVAALPGFYVVARRFQRNHTDALALMLIGAVGIYAYGAVFDNHNFGRVLPLVLFPAHVGIGILLADAVERRGRPHPALLGWIGVSALVGLAGVTPGLARTVPRALLPESVRERENYQPLTAPYGNLTGALPAGTILIAQNSDLAYVASAFGYGSVRPGRPVPFVDDLDARRRDVARFLDPATPAAVRDEIAARYDVRAVLCADDECVARFTAPGVGGNVVTSKDPDAVGRSWTLIALPPPPT